MSCAEGSIRLPERRKSRNRDMFRYPNITLQTVLKKSNAACIARSELIDWRLSVSLPK
jgi:hypothetical protein